MIDQRRVIGFEIDLGRLILAERLVDFLVALGLVLGVGELVLRLPQLALGLADGIFRRGRGEEGPLHLVAVIPVIPRIEDFGSLAGLVAVNRGHRVAPS